MPKLPPIHTLPPSSVKEFIERQLTFIIEKTSPTPLGRAPRTREEIDAMGRADQFDFSPVKKIWTHVARLHRVSPLPDSSIALWELSDPLVKDVVEKPSMPKTMWLAAALKCNAEDFHRLADLVAKESQTALPALHGEIDDHYRYILGMAEQLLNGEVRKHNPGSSKHDPDAAPRGSHQQKLENRKESGPDERRR